MLKKLLPALLGATLAIAAVADEASVKRNFEAKFGAKADSVTKSGYLGLYEIYADGQILYGDEKGTAFILGPLIDGKTMRNVTQERMNKLTAIKWNDLPLERAVKQVRGDGKRVLASFEDPNCGYCKRLAKELLKLDNVTIYTFLYPILSQDSVDKSKAIWCAADRAKAWNDWMVDGKAPTGKTDCDTTAITKNQDFGRKLNINGTPTLFFVDGERIPGAVPLAKIEEKLAQTAGK
ncbi:DsbC family protein [Azospira restricta]|uniref:Thiol:disulfide interchange protein n=1 Tax=Azospira restricta TaxID=404405 RepID=A0A974Y3M1_9RHOO|nr:DsbC family protein [Azospira restricta]QRJ63964.1 DsbC family protein [Azospira restricta]